LIWHRRRCRHGDDNKGASGFFVAAVAHPDRFSVSGLKSAPILILSCRSQSRKLRLLESVIKADQNSRRTFATIVVFIKSLSFQLVIHSNQQQLPETTPRVQAWEGRSVDIHPDLPSALRGWKTPRLHHFIDQFFDFFLHFRKRFPAFRGDFIIFPNFAVNELFVALQEAIRLQRVQDRVQCAGAELIAMPPQFLDDPKPVDWFFGSMMQEVNFDETEKKMPQHIAVMVIVSNSVIERQYGK
jgi:hypothetical protein